MANQSVRLKEEQLRREEEKVRLIGSSFWCPYLVRPTASRDRVTRPARDQREETRTFGQRGVSQVCIQCRHSLPVPKTTFDSRRNTGT